MTKQTRKKQISLKLKTDNNILDGTTEYLAKTKVPIPYIFGVVL
jgi:hypothetical protein